MQDNNRLIAHLFALGTTIVWGTTFISSKILLESLTPSEIIVYRFAIAIAFLYLLRPHFFRHGRGWRMEAAFAGAGLSGVSVYFLFENTALTYTYASNVGVIICTAPFFTGLASAIVFRDKLQGNFFWGFLVAMVLFSGVRRKVEQAIVPECFKGLPITLVAAAMTSLSFMGFGGIVEAIFGV